MIRIAIALSLTGLATGALGQDRPTLAGNWTVDLRPKPDAPAYLKPMVLTIAADGVLTGEFYERAIDKGRAIATNGRPCFAFRTQDLSGPYQSSGCLKDGVIEGQTWSEGRGFLLVWTARRTIQPAR